MALAMALPELEPEGSAFSKNGHVACPPRPEKPDGTLPRKLDHSDRLAFPRRRAPALRSLAAPSLGGRTTRLKWSIYYHPREVAPTRSGVHACRVRLD
jgi:hypothetical protein